MSNYFVLVYKGSSIKCTSVNLIIIGFLCVINLTINCIVYINAAVVNFDLSSIFEK